MKYQPLTPAALHPLNTSAVFSYSPWFNSDPQTFTQNGNGTWETVFTFYALNETDTDRIELQAELTEAEGTFLFDCGDVRGYIEPFSDGFWVIVEESTDSRIACRAYQYSYEIE